jgi:hypothetical protein
MEEKELGILFLASGDGSSILRGKETKPTQNANGHRGRLEEKGLDILCLVSGEVGRKKQVRLQQKQW